MKKFFIFITALIIATTSCKKDDNEVIAEDTTPEGFTISSSDFGNVGDTFYMAKDISNLDLVLTTSADDIWDFSFLSEDEVDTIIYYNPSIFPAFSDFPNANIAFDMNDGIAFAIKTTSMIEMIGFSISQSGSDVNIPLDDHLIINKFPFRKGSSFEDTGHGEITTSMNIGLPMNVDVKVVIDLTTISSIEEEAEMQLPGSSAKCLSENKVIISHIIATAMGSELLNQIDTAKSYNYYAAGKGTTFASVELDSLGKVINVTYLKEM